jgi:hypothetical protein
MLPLAEREREREREREKSGEKKMPTCGTRLAVRERKGRCLFFSFFCSVFFSF